MVNLDCSKEVTMDIKKLREKANMSREELAVKLKVSANTIYRWEQQGVNPHPIFEEKMNRIFKGLGVEE